MGLTRRLVELVYTAEAGFERGWRFFGSRRLGCWVEQACRDGRVLLVQLLVEPLDQLRIALQTLQRLV